MSGRHLWSSVINNTITEAINYFWRDGHHLEIRAGVAGLRKNKNELTSIGGLRASCSQEKRKKNKYLLTQRIAVLPCVDSPTVIKCTYSNAPE